MGARLIIEGLRGLGSGAESLGASLERKGARQVAEEERLRKQTQKQELDSRLSGAAGTIQDLSNLVQQNPNITRQEFETAATPLSQAAIQTGLPQISRSVDGLRSIFDQRDADIKAQQLKEADQAREDQSNKRITAKEKKERDDRLESQLRLFRSSDETKKTRGTGQSFDVIAKLAKQKPTAGRDWGIVFSVLKALDPNSTVREGEFASVRQARSLISSGKVQEDGSIATSKVIIPSFIVQLIQKLDPQQQGSFLIPEQVEDFKNLVGSTFKAQLERQQVFEKDTTDLANRFGIDPKLVIGSNSAGSRLEKFAAESSEKEVDKNSPPEEPGITVSASLAKEIANDPNKKITQDFLSKKKIFEEMQKRPMTPEEESQAFDVLRQAYGISIQGE